MILVGNGMNMPYVVRVPLSMQPTAADGAPVVTRYPLIACGCLVGPIAGLWALGSIGDGAKGMRAREFVRHAASTLFIVYVPLPGLSTSGVFLTAGFAGRCRGWRLTSH